MIEPLTPPIETEFSTEEKKTSGGTVKNYPDFDSLFSEMLAYYTPVTVNYQPMTAETIRAHLADWLRPKYDQAIDRRREQTALSRAAIDADAYARGMGSSTYVTDVKEQGFRAQERDISDLEASYGATLAEHLYEAVQQEADRVLEVEQFNAEQWNAAKEKAFDAATKLYATYAASGGSRGSNGKKTAADSQKSENKSSSLSLLDSASEPDWEKYSVEQIERMLNGMNSDRRRALFQGVGKENAQLRAHIVHSVGKSTYKRLLKEYRP